MAQYDRLTQSPRGRHILDRIGVTYDVQHGVKKEIPRGVREHIKAPPLPRNMHPEHHQDRRTERAKTLHKKFSNDRDVIYVDAAEYENGRNMAIVATNTQGDSTVSGTLRTGKAEVAEEVYSNSTSLQKSQRHNQRL